MGKVLIIQTQVRLVLLELEGVVEHLSAHVGIGGMLL